MPVYIVKRDDGMWLMSYRTLGVMMTDDGGGTYPVYACVWGSKRSRAHTFYQLWKAKSVMRGHSGFTIIMVDENGEKPVE